MKTPRVQSTALFTGKISWGVMAALALLAAYYRFQWPFLFLILFLCYLVWSYLWTVLSCRHFSAADSAIPESIFAGDTFTLKYSFINRWIFPLAHCGLSFYLPSFFLCSSNASLELTKDYEGYTDTPPEGTLPVFWVQGNVQYTYLPVKGERLIELKVTAPLRGYYYLPTVQFFVGDPSGLYQRMSKVGQESHLLVMPKLNGNMDLHKVLSYDENRSDDIYGLDDHYETIGVRDYQSSDSLKSINWYASARTKTLKTNLYQRKVSTSCLVVLDLSCGIQPAFELNNERVIDQKLEDAISFACGIALSQLGRGSNTAFFTNAPLLSWEKDEKAKPGIHREKLKRNMQITALDFAEGDEQEREILKVCATIDDTGRAALTDQELLWSRILAMPATMVYLVCYHKPPENWSYFVDLRGRDNIPNPANFYTKKRLAGLSSAHVRLFDFSDKQADKE